MTITKSQEAGVLTLVLTGRLDTVTAPELNKEVDEAKLDKG
jgi:anti-anti-sigma regulatory factor